MRTDEGPRPRGVLVVDDDPPAARYLEVALTEAGFEVRAVAGGLEALLAIERSPPALVITDLQMPGMSGLELLTLVRQRWPEMAVIVVSAASEVATIVEAIRLGAVNYLVKPVPPARIHAAAAQAMAGLRRQNAPAQDVSIAEIIGQTPAMVQVRHAIALAARSDANVVVTGETGTGKELVARAIRRLWFAGAPRPFVAHNCALTPADLFDSEFFGHRRGSFTGADRDRSGLLREADGGILFLDELECLSPHNQAKMLRVLDDGEVRPVGSEQVHSVSVRFIAATNRDPRAMLAARELREDLYFRLRGFQIELPPLAKRREDIPLIATHYLAPSRKRLTPEALVALTAHPWPGNVRELRSVVEVAAATSTVDLIDEGDLGLTSTGRRSTPAAPAPPERALSLQKSERQTILAALAAHGGNRVRAAEALGIHRSTLRRKLREIGMDDDKPD
jgi:two-component system NtrC family response regulator